MDRYLRSLLASSTGVSMDSNAPLSEIAKSILGDDPEGGANVREKAGLLALLNLLGIVDSFYGDAGEDMGGAEGPDSPCDTPVDALRPSSVSSSEARTTLPSASPEVALPPVSQDTASGVAKPHPSQPISKPDGPVSIAGTLAKLLGGMQGQRGPAAAPHTPESTAEEPAEPGDSPLPPSTAPEETQQAPPTTDSPPLPAAGGLAASQLESILPSLVQSLAGAAPSEGTVPSLAQALAGVMPSMVNLLANMDPAAIAGMVGMLSSAARQRPARTGVVAADADVGEGRAADGASPSQQAGSPHPQPSPLHQMLGFDPKILTLILNVLAELMKSKQSEPKEKCKEEREADMPKASSPTPTGPSTPAPTKAPELRPPRRPQIRAHKPGLGIRRYPCAPRPKSGSEDGQ